MQVEVHEILRLRAAPLVDGLIRIADDEQVPVAPRHQVDQLDLARAAVLEFIDLHIMQFLLPFLQHFREIIEQHQGEVNQVVKIEPKDFALLQQITLDDLLFQRIGFFHYDAALHIRQQMHILQIHLI